MSSRTVPILALILSAAGLLTVLLNGSGRVDPAPPAAAGSRGRVAAAEREPDDRLDHALARAPRAFLSAASIPDAPASSGVPRADRGAPDAATLAELREFREYVAVTLSEFRREKVAEGLRALEERAAGIDDTLASLAEWLALEPHQTDRLRSAMLVQLDSEAEYLRLWERGADEGILNELKARDRATLREELAGFLTAKQVERYLSRAGGGD